MQTRDKTVMTINPFFPFTLYLTNVSTMEFLEISYSMRNLVKLEICSFVMNFNSKGIFSKDTVLCDGYWLWAWQISGGLQTCIPIRSKVPDG